MDRKNFLQTGLASAGCILFTSSVSLFQDNKELFTKDEIYEFVLAAHRDLEATRKIVESKPLILNCANQSKKGDFETAIGGASHMGRKDIAELLQSKGARLDIFSMTFLGYESIVRQLIEMQPNLLKAPGPHGFSLLHHAEVGKHEGMAEWLQEKGLNTKFFKGAFG